MKKKLTQRVLSFLLAFLMLFGTVFQTQLTFAQENDREDVLQGQNSVEETEQSKKDLDDLMDDVIFEEVDNSNDNDLNSDEDPINKESVDKDDLEDKKSSTLEAIEIGEDNDEISAKNTAGKDVSKILTGPNFRVVQENQEISENGIISSESPISILSSFKVPVLGDGLVGSNIVEKGDFAIFDISNSLSIDDSLLNISEELKFGSLVVGHIKFFEEDNSIKVRIDFDGDDSVFEEYTDVSVEFSSIFDYDDEGDAGNSGDHEISIYDKTFTVRVPEEPNAYSMTKEGKVDLENKKIIWTSTIEARKDGEHIDLEGHQFYDDLNYIGEYVEGSFKAGHEVIDSQVVYEGGVLRYDFPKGSLSPQTIEFETKITDEDYYVNGQIRKDNTAYLFKDEETLSYASGTAVEDINWISKSGASSDKVEANGSYESTGRTISWEIVVNENEQDLNGLIITDTLPEGLDWESAKWEKFDGSDWTEGSIFESEPKNGEYSIGNVSEKVKLTIVSKVPDEDYTGTSKTYTNNASVKWLDGEDYIDGIESGGVGVDVGFSAINKSGELSKSPQASVKWSINVDTKGQSVPDLVVYDLLVYGPDDTDLNGAVGFPEGINLNEVTHNYNQKYKEDSFSSTDDLDFEVKEITKDGKRVADLLIVKSKSEEGLNQTNFTFNSILVNPEQIADNSYAYIYNTANLFTNDKPLSSSRSSVYYDSNVLAKEIIERGSDVGSVGGANQYSNDPTKGFDYEDKSVVFRLVVNADGVDLSNTELASGEKLGQVTIKDQLPEGWEFTDISEGKSFLVYEGIADGNTVIANDGPVELSTLEAKVGESEAEFNFNELSKPYVILVKAKLTDEKVEEYFNTNGSYYPVNKVNISFANSPVTAEETQEVYIESKILGKTVNLEEAGVLNWELNYVPHHSNLAENLKLVDTLPEGIELRTDSSGKLDLQSISITEMSVKQDGSLEEVSNIDSISDYVDYNSTTRELTFTPISKDKVYKFNYITDITGGPGLTVSNKVSLQGMENLSVEDETSYTVSNLDSSATLKRAGWFKVNKIDGYDNSPLSDAEFTIYATDKTTVIRKGLTNSNGELFFRGLVKGEYILKETKAPEGYDLIDKEHTIKVIENEDGMVIEIDGGILEDRVFEVENNTIGSATTTIEGQKNWDDANNQDGKRPESITVRLWKNGEQVDSREVSEANDWKWSFTDLQKFEDNELINYTISEDAVEGYSSTITDYDITNTYSPGKTSVQVTKVWDDENNKDGVRPESVTIKLLADSIETDRTLVLSEENNWTDTFTELDEYKDGKKIEYSIEEIQLENGYSNKITGDSEIGFTVTNKRVSWTPLEPTTRNISVSKQWKNKDDSLATSIKDRVVVELYRDGLATGEKIELNEVNEWKGQFKNLPTSKGILSLKQYKYTVKEVGEENNVITIGDQSYEVVYEGDMKDGFIITNKVKPSSPGPVDPPKPVDPEETEPTNPIDPEGPKPTKPGDNGGSSPTNKDPQNKKPVDTGKVLPNTGDGLNTSLYALVALVFGGLIVIAGLRMKKNEKQK